uniref:Uncharacterized protein n=1 Tax=Acrobeloides nanus TaxID=290746 RepID=A0A914C590_9BILA
MNSQEMVSRLAQLWTVARCKCLLRYSRSESHLDCLFIEPWIVEQLEQIASLHRNRLSTITYQISEERSPDCTESLDSLQVCGRNSTFGWLSQR